MKPYNNRKFHKKIFDRKTKCKSKEEYAHNMIEHPLQLEEDLRGVKEIDDYGLNICQIWTEVI
jgi:hypothetical protein